MQKVSHKWHRSSTLRSVLGLVCPVICICLTEYNANWEAEPETVPNVKWSDMFVYMITTLNEYTKDEMMDQA